MSLNRKVSGREMRRHNMAVVSATENAIMSLETEILNDRRRIMVLEEFSAKTATFWGRLRWLVGR